MPRIAFLDRDGVLNKQIIKNRKPSSPRDFSEIEILSGVIEAIKILKQENFVPVVITNQPDVARGNTTAANVEAVNEHLCRVIGVEHVFTCFHDDSDKCNCRKPRNGLLMLAGTRLQIPLKDSIMVGDRITDIEAGFSIGANCYLVENGEPIEQSSVPFIRVSSLLEVAYSERNKIDNR
jgi:D-glycero-D-manno-heptose 1,7-bisphosphate phosphatase